MEYSIMDAIRAGFTKVVFIIKPDMLDKMKEICAKKFEGKIDLRYAFQDFSSVPAVVPEERVKPFGTVHAVLCAKEHVSEPFAVINADDYYGADAFRAMHAFLLTAEKKDAAAMLGYRLKNTVSMFGAVTRGVCRVENGVLTGVKEIPKVQLMADGRIMNVVENEELDPDSMVSMNFWGFGEGIFEELEKEFGRFLGEIQEGDLRAEYLLPVFVDEQLKAGKMTVSVLPTASTWFGVTYQEDRPRVAAALRKLHEQGLYAG
jgi:dTDP-glucose pyrophosphorylase